MPRRSRLRTEKRLQELEAFLQAQPAGTTRPAIVLEPEAVAQVLSILEEAVGADHAGQMIHVALKEAGRVAALAHTAEATEGTICLPADG